MTKGCQPELTANTWSLRQHTAYYANYGFYQLHQLPDDASFGTNYHEPCYCVVDKSLARFHTQGSRFLPLCLMTDILRLDGLTITPP